MDNYNGQNPMSENQNVQQPVPQPVQPQMQYQQPGYYAQPNYAKPKSGGLKWLLIIGIPAFLAVVTLATLLIIGILFPSYDIDDYEEVYDACYDVFDIKLEKAENISSYMKEEGVVGYAYGENEASKYGVSVRWYKFSSESKAEKYYEEHVADLEDEYLEEVRDYELSKWKSNSSITEAYLGEDGEIEKAVVIREDEYVMVIWFEGKKGTVEDLSDEFLNEID